MTIPVECPWCKQLLGIFPEAVGQEMVCTQCRRPFYIGVRTDTVRQAPPSVARFRGSPLAGTNPSPPPLIDSSPQPSRGFRLVGIFLAVLFLFLVRYGVEFRGTKSPVQGMTKAEFRGKLAAFEPLDGRKFGSPRDPKKCWMKSSDFHEAFGNPTDTQTIAGSRMLYWNCRDGTIQVHLASYSEDERWFIESVNDY